jgi:hypothetical protein
MALQYNPSTINQQASNAIGTYHLADNPNLYEIQRSNNFEFIVTGLDNILRPGVVGDENNARIGNAQEVIRLSVTRCPIPHFTQQPISVRRGNSELKYAGVPTFSSGTLEVNDFIGADTKSVLMAWQNLSYNIATEKVGLMQDYKKQCTLIEYSPDYQVVRQWKLYGCWISGIQEGDYSSDDNSKHTITATIEYDKAQIDTSELE